MSWWYSLLDALPFAWVSMNFMKNALLAVLVMAPLFGLLSTVIVTGRMSFFSDALGHSAFTGIAIGVLCGVGAADDGRRGAGDPVRPAVQALSAAAPTRRRTPSSACSPRPPWRWAFSSPPWAAAAFQNLISI